MKFDTLYKLTKVLLSTYNQAGEKGVELKVYEKVSERMKQSNAALELASCMRKTATTTVIRLQCAALAVKQWASEQMARRRVTDCLSVQLAIQCRHARALGFGHTLYAFLNIFEVFLNFSLFLFSLTRKHEDLLKLRKKVES